MTITTNGARQEPNARSEGKGDDTERLASAKREAIVEGSSAARPFEDEELGRYQAAFLRLFIQDLTPDQLLHELRTLPDFAPYQSTNFAFAFFDLFVALTRVLLQNTLKALIGGVQRLRLLWCTSGCASASLLVCTTPGENRGGWRKIKNASQQAVMPCSFF